MHSAETIREKLHPNTNIRFANLDDLDELERIEKSCWKDLGASRELIKHRLETAKDCMVVGYNDDGKIISQVTVLKIKEYDETKPTNWDYMSLPEGYSSMYDPKGEYLFGVNLTADPQNKKRETAVEMI